MKYPKDDPRGYKVKGKKMLPKPYNLRRKQAVNLAKSIQHMRKNHD